jgi:histone-arginine methyltransferase CARM1
MGFLLVHERMLEVFVSARDLWMKPGGLMLPSCGNIYVNVFTDANIFQEQLGKVDFWKTKDFYGLDLSCLEPEAVDNHFSQPVVGYFNPDILLSDKDVEFEVDFSKISLGTLKEFDIPVSFEINKTALLHGLACWFDVNFNGTDTQIKLCTGPRAPHTHWYQCRLMFKEPLAVNRTQTVTGNMHFKVNEKSSYHIDIELEISGTKIKAENRINLHDQMYHYLTQPYPEQTAQQWDAQDRENLAQAGY